MPIPVAQKSHIRERLGPFTGVNLRRDRMNLADEDLARAVNADLHTKPGSVLRRLGRSLQFTTPLDKPTIRFLEKRGLNRYQIAGQTIYYNQTEIFPRLSEEERTHLVHARPLNDTATWTFIGDAGFMHKHDGTNYYNWGIAQSSGPTIAIGDGTGLTGAYSAVYTHARVVGGTVIHESNPGTAPAAVTLTNEDLDITVIRNNDAQVTNIRIYRTAAGGSSYLFDQQVANNSTVVTSSQADTALGTAVETDNDFPNFMTWVVEFQGHIFACRDALNPHYLWWSKRFRPEAFPSGNFLEIGHPDDPLQCAVPLAGFLGIFSRLAKYRVFGNTTSGFTYLEALSSRGTPAPSAVLATERGVFFPARDGFWATNFVDADVELSQAIEGLFHGEAINGYFPVNWDAPEEMSTAVYKDRLYFCYQDTNGTQNLAVYSFDTQKWYFFEVPVRRLFVEEDVDHLVGGFGNGLVYILESPSAMGDVGSAITTTIETPERFGLARYVLKRFDWLLVDTEGDWIIEIYIDDVLRHIISVTGVHHRNLLRLPDRLMGYTYYLRAWSTGTDRAAFHSAEVLMWPLEEA